MKRHEYVTIMAVSSAHDEICIVDQVPYETAYKTAWGNHGPNPPLSGHYSCMRTQWPSNWIIISKESWEQKYGKIVYP